jgi:glycosyltransferase involved in cell wall biosynthesis
MNTVEPLDYTGIASEYMRVGMLVSEYTCVAEKILGEMGDFFRQNKVIPIMVKEENPKSIIEYFPDAMIYLRCGTKPGTPVGILASVDGHIAYFRSLEIPVYYYLDDAFFQANDYAPLKILLNSDEAILATSALVDHVKKSGYTKPIHLLKTHMSIPTFDLLPPSDAIMDRNKINVFYTSEGRIGTLMLDRICERIAQAPGKYKDVRIVAITQQVAQLRSIINRWRGFEKIYYERVPLAEYYGLFKMMDIVIAPGEPGDLNYFLHEDDQPLWLASKSCVKYTIAGAAGLPCIASSWLKEYEMAIKQGETGFIATDIDEWMEYLDLLIFNEAKRKEMGLKAREDVVANWNIIDRAKQFTDILKGNSPCRVQ